MFGKQNDDTNFKEVETIIGPSVKVKGNFHGEGNIVVEGIIEGGLKTAGNVLVGDKAHITANIEANEARVGGAVNGNIKVKGDLAIEATAKINGDIECAFISIERGAMLNGKCSMGKIKSDKIKDSEEVIEE
jgi:cytoskeletal protein CcmA (bactofilin family)